MSFGDIYLQFYRQNLQLGGISVLKIVIWGYIYIFSFMVKNLQLGDKCTQNCHLGIYIFSFMVKNLQLGDKCTQNCHLGITVHSRYLDFGYLE